MTLAPSARSLAGLAITCGVLALLLPAARADDDGGLARLAWLAGCWRSVSGEAGTGEHWMAPAGGTMLGMSRTVRAGRTVEHEFMLIRAAAAGTLVFVAQPSGQRPATFTLLSLSDTEVVFQNPQHDFPQRIAYRRQGEAALTARIEGVNHGTARVIEFAMVRTGCEAPRAEASSSAPRP